MPLPVARAGADLRLIRAAVFTAVCVVLSAGGHVLASCAKVPLWTLVAAGAAVLAVAVPLAGRERSLPGIAAALAVGQLALHALFALGQHGTRGADAAAAHRAGGDGHLIDFAGQLLCDQRPMSADRARQVITNAGLDPAVHTPAASAPGGGAGPGAGSFVHALLPSPAMVLGHLLAALALGWLLRRGEAALWRLVRLSAESARGVAESALVRALAVALLPFVRALGAEPLAVPRWRAAARDERPARQAEWRHVVIRRGPPRLALAA
ncbi:hypothetical protein [Streptomyces sp. UNOB3_S3]|uniref:hypothetical protein n=1 Tax=Streptomyces sp. UNOB3_S3 TaxID=2871682 RepID=UPI001E509797|nr:hypothetical protein [Streptomyces sp. UNOB3_S3]MCC3775485.1 hypothetical protein [Streptomyces sp. UNOB3_S3]